MYAGQRAEQTTRLSMSVRNPIQDIATFWPPCPLF